jgi:hypothetical protein
MNFSSPFDAAVFGIMGLFILFNSLMAAWLLVLWCIAKMDYQRAVVWGVRIGLLMLLAASAEGFRIVLQGSHTVGAADGGPGLPFVNWSTEHGDLRVAHFFGLHALQLFPIAGFVLAATRLRERTQIGLLAILGALYGAGVFWLFVQAMHGTPFIPARAP